MSNAETAMWNVMRIVRICYLVTRDNNMFEPVYNSEDKTGKEICFKVYYLKTHAVDHQSINNKTKKPENYTIKKYERKPHGKNLQR